MTLHTTKYQLPTPFPRHNLDKILKVKVTTARSKVKSRSYHDAAHLQPPPMSLPSINFIHLIVSEIWPRHDLIGQGHYGKVKGQVKVAP